MYSVRRTAVLPAVGFPIRVSADHRPFSASSRLIAAVHALHRLLVPRHPPCALDILTVILIDLAVARPKERRAPFTSRRRSGPRAGGDRRDIRLLDDCAVFKVRQEGAGRGLRPSVSQSSTACRRPCARRPLRPKAASSAGASAPRPARSTLGTCPSGTPARYCAVRSRDRRSSPGAP